MPSEKVLNQKKAKVEELSEKFKKAKMIVLTEYRGITVEQDTALRSQIRENGDEYMVAKNSIITHAAKEAGIEGFDITLEELIKISNGKQELEVTKCAYNSWFKGLGFEEVKVYESLSDVTILLKSNLS